MKRVKQEKNIIEIYKLRKVFRRWRIPDVTAVEDVSFSVKKGEIIGLLGPNGAGKTTTLQMLLGVLEPTSGEIRYFGQDFKHLRSSLAEKINFSSTYTNLPWLLTVEEALLYTSYLYSIQNRKKRLEELKVDFSLESLWKRPIRTLSNGQMARVNLAKSFINMPDILFLDEPTASLDPVTAQEIRHFLLREREKRNLTIIFSSHNMKEVENMADKVVFLHKGKVLTVQNPKDFSSQEPYSLISMKIISKKKIFKEISQKYNIEINKQGEYFKISLPDKKVDSFLYDCYSARVSFSHLEILKNNLEDFFMHFSEEK